MTEPMRDRLRVMPGDEPVCIRSSDIAFTLGHHGPLLGRARNYQGEVDIY